MTIPSRSTSQDPVSQQLWNISKQLEELTAVFSKIVLPIDTTSTTTTTIPSNSLTLTFDDIVNADLMVGDSTSVTDWNTFFDLPTNGTAFSSVEVAGNAVNLKGGSGITLTDSLFTKGGYGASLLSIVDTLGCIVTANFDVFGDYTYASCANLKTVSFPSLITAGGSCFINCSELTFLDLSSLTIAGDDCFYNCSGLISPNFSALTSAGNNCFSGCSGLISPNFNALTICGDNCFYSCSGLISDFNSLTTVGSNCFNYCSGLISPNFPILTTVGDGCFIGCTSLITINLPVCTTLGTSFGDNGVFSGITNNTIVLTIPTALMTCNDGITTFDPDGDIQYLNANNTLTIIQV